MDNEISLAIETSGRIGSVALAKGTDIIDEITFSAPLKHGSETLPAIDTIFQKNCLKPENLDCLYVSSGPGSFTGIRLAVTMAKTIAFAVNAKIIAVPSMEAQILNGDLARKDGINFDNIGVVLEAGRGNIFALIYKYSPDCHIINPESTYVPNYTPVLNAEMLTPKEFLSKSPDNIALIGEGIRYHQEEFVSEQISILEPTYHKTSASYILKCGFLRRTYNKFTDSDSFTPNYMRKPEAELNLQKEAGS